MYFMNGLEKSGISLSQRLFRKIVLPMNKCMYTYSYILSISPPIQKCQTLIKIPRKVKRFLSYCTVFIYFFYKSLKFEIKQKQ